jgi:hypothetical protein
VERIERAKSMLLEVASPLRLRRRRYNGFPRKRQQRFRASAAVGNWVAAHLKAKDGAAHPNHQTLSNHAQNLLNGLRLGAHPPLSLIVRQTAEATRIQINLH